MLLPIDDSSGSSLRSTNTFPSSNHEDAPALTYTTLRLEDPWREQDVEVDSTNPRLNHLILHPSDLNLREILDLSALAPTVQIPDADQVRAIRNELANESSGALQARTGTGKTLISIYLAAYFIKHCPDQHVIISCPTNLVLQQTAKVAKEMFAQSDGVTVLHKSLPKVRAAAYGQPTAKLIIASASALALDASLGRLKREDVSLLMIDEAHLTRGREAAALLQQWSVRHQLKTLLCSATLTETTTPTKAEISEVKTRFQIPRFNLMPSKRGAKYSVSREQLELSTQVSDAAALIADDFRDRLADIKIRVGGIESHLADVAETRCAALLKRSLKGQSLSCLPSPPAIKSVVNAIDKATDELSGHKDSRPIFRDALTLMTLAHLHQLLTTQPRVGFLEYAGGVLFSSRTGSAKAHHQTLFPPGRAPKWWTDMSRGTPYDVLNKLIPEEAKKASARVLVEALNNSNPSITIGTVDEARAAFFASKQLGLGIAARGLIQSKFEEHPKVQGVINWINGSIRQKQPGQVLVYNSEIITTLYLAAKIAASTHETVVPIVGSQGLNAAQRKENFHAAHTNLASVACCTSIGGVGLDMQNVRYLLVLHPTADLREWNQICGRAGRREPGDVIFLTTRGYGDAIREFAREAKQRSRGVPPSGKRSLKNDPHQHKLF